MFESSLCERSMLKVPVDNDVWAFRWLSKPVLLVIMLVIAFFVIHWIMKKPERRRWFSSPKGFLLMFGLTAFFPLLLVAANQALVVFLPPDPGTRVDAIVVVGRGWPLLNERVATVTELWKAGRAPRIFASGKTDTPNMIKLLKEKGIPDDAIDGENCSITTEENALFSAAILKPQGVQRILMVTDESHMLRTLLSFQAYGFKVFPKISAVPEHWNIKERGFFKVREFAGLIHYGLRGVFFPQNLSNVKNPELKTLVKEAEQYSRNQRL
jgi:uncharacterized SAM-binding protein YcdF (DUF218 family)